MVATGNNAVDPEYVRWKFQQIQAQFVQAKADELVRNTNIEDQQAILCRLEQGVEEMKCQVNELEQVQLTGEVNGTTYIVLMGRGSLKYDNLDEAAEVMKLLIKYIEYDTEFVSFIRECQANILGII